MFTKPTFLNRGLVIMLIASLFSTSLLTIFPAQAAPLAQSTGYWRFLEAVTTKPWVPTVGGSLMSADVSISEGQSSMSQIYGDPEPHKYIVNCTWSWSAPNGLYQLTPGEILKGTMTMTDQSQLYRTYDGFDHGSSGGNGSIYIDQPYIGTAYTAGYSELLGVSVGYQKSATQAGQLTVPGGSGWDGKMGLKASCFGGVYERIYEWVLGSPPTPTKTITPTKIVTPTTTPVPTGKKPCAEAVQKYALDPNKPTQMQYDYADLKKQFEQALQKYETNNIQKAFAQDNIAGTLPALSWLANQGGTVDVLSKQFIFTSDTDRKKWDNKIIPANEATLGTEPALYEAMYNAAKNGKKLTPGDVFYLALVQRNGNAKEAMLLAHNTLRSFSRENDFPLTLVNYDPDFVRSYLAPVITGGPLGPGQNDGAWYHLFGVAYFEMQARGTWGAYTLVQMTGDQAMDAINKKMTEILKVLKKDPELKLAENKTLYSDLANEVEQLYRKYKTASPDDPLKYCYNVWGAQLGSWLYQKRLEIRPAPQLPPPLPPGVSLPTLFGPVPLGPRPTGYSGDKNNPATWFSSSPLKITWENSQYKMVLDQQSNSLYGYFPADVFPYYEPDTKTWGMIWAAQTGSEDYRMTLEATQNGWAHMTRLNNGQPQVYSIALKVGDKLTLDISASQPTPALVRSNGQKITPLVLPTTSGSSTCTQLQASRVSWLARDASSGQLYEVSAYPSGTKETIPAFFYPCVPAKAKVITQISRDGKSVSFKSDLTASSTEGWFYLTLAYDTAYTDGLYDVSFYADQVLLGSGQVRIGNELVTNAEMAVNGLVLDDATQKPLAKAWVAVLLPGITAGDWQELEFPESAVLAYGLSDSQGRFSLVDPVDMATPVYLERNIAYSVFAWLDGYQNMLADDLIIGDSQSSPVKLTITLRR